VRKHGIHRGALTAAYVGQYAIAWSELGEFPTAVAYAEYWAISERTAFLHRSKIADVFGEKWPEVVEAVKDEIDRSQSRSLARAGQLPLPQT
jgi:hypothetical protein